MSRIDGKIVVGTAVDTGGINTGLRGLEGHIDKMANFAKLSAGIGVFLALGKSAVGYASDLQEVQNIVDNTFKSMSYKIEQFSNVSIREFGISRLAAKQTAGSFMAMGSSMGLAGDEASDMAVELTGLTGDFASFYNLQQEYARTAISAVYTGETETLKRYGIVMTNANLNAYALSQGIQTNIMNMDAASKARLRYSYIMQATQDIEGDFLRTQYTWANQLRVLKELWKEFMIVLGDGLITVLTPLLRGLNALVTSLINFANTIRQILTNVFGVKFQSVITAAASSQAIMADSATEASDAEKELADATEKASKEAKKALAPFDDLNVLQQQTASNLGGVGGGGGAGGGGESIPAPTVEAPEVDTTPFYSSIENLYDLGRFISDTLEGTLRRIDWQKIYSNARNFGKGLAQFLNGLISPTLFYQLGKTISNSINTAIYTALSFGQEFDWTNFGNALGEGINGFFKNFDAAAFAEAINVWVQGIFDTIMELIHTIDWGQIAKTIFDFVSNLDLKTIGIILGGIAWKLKFNPVTSLLKFLVPKFAKMAAMKNVLPPLSPTLKAPKVSLITKVFSSAGKLAGTLFTKAFGVPFSAVTGVFSKISAVVGPVATKLGTMFAPVLNVITKVGSKLGTIFGPLMKAIGPVAKVFSKLFEPLLKIGAKLGLKFIPVVGIIITIIDALLFVIKHLDTIKEIIGTIADWIKTNVIDPVAGFFVGLWEGIKEVWGAVCEWFSTYIIEPIVQNFQQKWEAIKAIFAWAWEGIKAIWGAVSSWFDTYIIQPIANFFGRLKDGIVLAFTVAKNKVTQIWGAITGWFKRHIIDPVVNAWQTGTARIAWFFSNLWDGIKSGVKGAMNFLISKIESGINFMVSGLNGILSGINKVISAVGKVVKQKWSGIPKIPRVNLPRLAQGAVIPPNKEFLAVLGDQRRGTNIEAPLDTIVNAMERALQSKGGIPGQGSSQPITLNIDGKPFARLIVPLVLSELSRLGYNVKVLEA